MITSSGFCLCVLNILYEYFDMINGAPRTVMLAFFGVGIALSAFSFWAVYLTDIPLEQFEQDPRFEEDYTKYHQWLLKFVIDGVIF